jgi:hypothetical protein
LTVLVTSEGDIKIGTPETGLVDLSLTWNTASQECCREFGSSNVASLQDVRALGYIVMELMQKYIKDDGAVGVENLDRWLSDSNAVGFLSMTTSTTSVNGLMKVRLIGLSLWTN